MVIMTIKIVQVATFAAAVVATSLSIAGPADAAAHYLTGNDLYSSCQSPSGSALRYGCFSYIQGVVDAEDEEVTLAKVQQAVQQGQHQPLYQGATGHFWCIPPEVALSQVVDVVVQFLHDHPAERHAGAAGLVNGALTKAWPCHQ
jgi:hypothetical protein